MSLKLVEVDRTLRIHRRYWGPLALRWQAMPLCLFLSGLGCEPSRTTPPVTPADSSPAPSQDVKALPPVGPSLCFGILVDFSGALSDEQERRVPDTLQGAYHVESVRRISSAELAKEMRTKEKVAEESRDGIDYVALRDFRCVEFEGGVSGQMIVIERYQIADK